MHELWERSPVLLASWVFWVLLSVMLLFMHNYRQSLVRSATTNNQRTISQVCDIVSDYLEGIDTDMELISQALQNPEEYRREFFDRDYTVREASARVWKYAKKYKLRLAIGVVCGMATAGTLVPFFQIVQPALQHVESHDNEVEVGSRTGTAVTAAPVPIR